MSTAGLQRRVANDLLARWLNVDVVDVTSVFRWLLLALPLLVGYLTYAVLRALVGSGASRLTEMPIRALRRTSRNG